ncbi:MAG: HAMP domain-containing histidine kinase, partial [Candidatus Nealsonbacteria bacterium]|nr:HAMP domain-containing histidine kinase [Candidatus Nealsonbacteria bacterium]
LIMGLINIGSSMAVWSIGNKFVDNPEAVTLIVFAVTVVLLIIAFIITQSFDKLAQANRMKSEFVSIVSHQLRSPLANLKWAIEFMMSGKIGPIGEKQLEYFKILKENLTRMVDLVSGLLTVSKIETAKLPFKKAEFFLNDLVKNVVRIFTPFASASNVKINLLLPADLPKIISDYSQVSQVVSNLLDNALRYIKNSGEIGIKTEKKNGYLYFEIKDTGVGIPQADQKYIFQKFFRSENVMKYQTQGSGLGLYISKAIIEKAGGKIGFKSQEGSGSTFWFTLPLK